jgi:hypothetical protein
VRLGIGVILLHDGHDEFQMHIQFQLEERFVGIDDSGGQGLSGGQGGTLSGGGPLGITRALGAASGSASGRTIGGKGCST